MPAVKAGVIVMDAALTIFCFLMAFKLRENTSVFSPTAWAWSQAFVPYAGILYFAVNVKGAVKGAPAIGNDGTLYVTTSTSLVAIGP